MDVFAVLLHPIGCIGCSNLRRRKARHASISQACQPSTQIPTHSYTFKHLQDHLAAFHEQAEATERGMELSTLQSPSDSPSTTSRPLTSTCRRYSATGWRRCIGCCMLQVSFRKRATNYRALLQKITFQDRHFMGLHHPVRRVLSACVIREVKGWGRDPKKCTWSIWGWGRVPFNEPYVPSLSIIYDGV